MNKTKRYRLSQDVYKIIQNANGGLFLLYTRHNPGDVLNLLLDGNDIGLMCRVESRHDQYYKYCKVIKEGENDINRGTTGNVEILGGLPGTGTLPVELMTGRISTNGGIVNLEYMIKKITPDAMK